MAQRWILLGSIFGFFGVALGAFGAHALRDQLSERALAIYQTATQYQLVHAIALLAWGAWCAQANPQPSSLTGWCFTAGIVFFSGSLYALAITDIKPLGAITPIGGVLFVIGWANIAFQTIKSLK